MVNQSRTYFASGYQGTLLDVFKHNDPVLIEAPVGPMSPGNFRTRAQAERPASVSS